MDPVLRWARRRFVSTVPRSSAAPLRAAPFLPGARGLWFLWLRRQHSSRANAKRQAGGAFFIPKQRRRKHGVLTTGPAAVALGFAGAKLGAKRLAGRAGQRLVYFVLLTRKEPHPSDPSPPLMCVRSPCTSCPQEPTDTGAGGGGGGGSGSTGRLTPPQATSAAAGASAGGGGPRDRSAHDRTTHAGGGGDGTTSRGSDRSMGSSDRDRGREAKAGSSSSFSSFSSSSPSSSSSSSASAAGGAAAGQARPPPRRSHAAVTAGAGSGGGGSGESGEAKRSHKKKKKQQQPKERGTEGDEAGGDSEGSEDEEGELPPSGTVRSKRWPPVIGARVKVCFEKGKWYVGFFFPLPLAAAAKHCSSSPAPQITHTVAARTKRPGILRTNRTRLLC